MPTIMPVENNSIRKKLIYIIMGITFAGLLTASIIQLVTGYFTLLSEVKDQLNVTADLTGKNIASALDFMDSEAAAQNLSSLDYEQSIFRACVFDKSGNLFASYSKKNVHENFFHKDGAHGCPKTKDELTFHTGINDIHVLQPVVLNKAELGWVFLDYDMSGVYAAFFRDRFVSLIVTAFALFMTYFLAIRLQRVITDPIYHLSETARILTKTKDFSVRAKKESDDELGLLVDTFNQMLDGIETRDRELVKARHEADQANQLKGQFLATMSHEIRTPMTGILGMAELLLGSKLESRQEGHVRTIVNSAESLLNIINDILDFSKIEAGKLELDPMPVDMLAIVDDIGLLYSVQAREKAVELVVYYHPGSEQFIFADPVRLRQIISNLVGNAIKFTEKGYIVLSIEEDKEAGLPADKTQLIVKVRDTGIGIPSEVQGKIFDKFSQADTSTTRKFGGTGLGLAICKNLVEMMDGKISLESEPGKGSTFTFKIPFTRNHTEAEKRPEIKSLQGVKILIVDDLHVVLKLISEQLEEVGARCDVALNGEDALRRMEAAAKAGDPFQVVVIDYLMPEMNGEMLACAIKDNPAISDSCLVMLTAAGNPIASDTYAEKGFSAHMAKPVQQNIFVEGIAYIWSEYQEGHKNVLIRLDLRSAGNGRDDSSFILRGAKVLMAEDNLVNQVFIEEIISEMQCELTIVQNGKEALEAVQKENFDVVLMDCLMPVMDGFEASREICKLKREGKVRADLPIIALTANAMKGDREKCLEAGMDEYLSKPIRKKELKETVFQWVTGKEVGMKADDNNSHDQVSSAKDRTASEANSPHSNLILDKEAVATARSILKGKYDTMVTIYIENSKERIEEITQAIKANDTEGVIRPAHSLKSTSKQMGALRLADVAEDVELTAKALVNGERIDGRDMNFIVSSLEDLEELLKKTKEAFESMAA